MSNKEKSGFDKLKLKKKRITIIVVGGFILLILLALQVSGTSKNNDALEQAKEKAKFTSENFTLNPSDSVDSEDVWRNKSADDISSTKKDIEELSNRVVSLKKELSDEKIKNSPYLIDENGKYILDENGEKQVNPNFNQNYTTVQPLIDGNMANENPMIEKDWEQVAKEKEENKQLKRDVEQLKKELEKSKRKQIELENKKTKIIYRDRNVNQGNRQLPPPPSYNGRTGNVTMLQEANKALQKNNPNFQPQSQNQQQQPQSNKNNGIQRHSLQSKSDAVSDEKNVKKNSRRTKVDETIKFKNVSNYIPSGTFGRVVLLSGVDAPTGGLAQSNPIPILLKFKDKGQLANYFETDLKECIVIGETIGNLASERAFIRTKTITCILANGQILEEKIEGYLAGEDGKAGFRGKVVSKQGSLIAKSAMAGLASGVSSALSAQISKSEKTSDANAIFRAGAVQGANNALDKIAQYYIDRANETYPIIEIDAGRIGELVIIKGLDLKAPHINKKRAN